MPRKRRISKRKFMTDDEEMNRWHWMFQCGEHWNQLRDIIPYPKDYPVTFEFGCYAKDCPSMEYQRRCFAACEDAWKRLGKKWLEKFGPTLGEPCFALLHFGRPWEKKDKE